MAKVNSVLGPLETSELGFTLGHEHVAVGSGGIQHVFPELFDRRAAIKQSVEQLRAAYKGGVQTIVDVTTHDLGRDIRLLREVSRRSKVQIIACTGTWLDIPRAFRSSTPDTIASLYVREVQVGIEGSDIKAGVIKVATDTGVTPEGEIVLRAAARAHKRTGVPITTHTRALDRVGEQQVRIFEEEGADPSKVCIGHSNNTLDKDYLLGLLRKGVWLGLDQYPGGQMPGTPNWEERTVLLKGLIDAGYSHRLLLSHDHVAVSSMFSQQMQEERRRLNPDGYLFITRRVLPRMKEMGIAEGTIRQITVENPRRFFEGR